jgi:hypothetical protein
MSGFDPVANKTNRVQNLMALEQEATSMSEAGAPSSQVSQLIDQGSKAVAANYPDLPEYEKAVSAAGRYRQMKLAENPQTTLDAMPLS